jgi:hypothetical protein
MVSRTAVLGVALFSVLVVACSEAPVVPIQPTSRRVLAELITEVT